MKAKLAGGWGFLGPAILFALAASFSPVVLLVKISTGGMYDPWSGDSSASPWTSLLFAGFAFTFSFLAGVAGYRKAAVVICAWAILAPIAGFIALQNVNILPDG